MACANKSCMMHPANNGIADNRCAAHNCTIAPMSKAIKTERGDVRLCEAHAIPFAQKLVRAQREREAAAIGTSVSLVKNTTAAATSAATSATKKTGAQVGNVDTNRTFDTIMRRMFEKHWGKMDANAQVAAQTFVDLPPGEAKTVTSVFDKHAQNVAGYLVASKMDAAQQKETYLSALMNEPEQVRQIVQTALTGSKADTQMADKASGIASMAKTQLADYNKAVVTLADVHFDKNSSADARTASVAAVRSAGEAFSKSMQLITGNLALQAEVSRRIEAVYEHTIRHTAKLSTASPSNQSEWNLKGKKFHVRAIEAGQSLSKLFSA